MGVRSEYISTHVVLPTLLVRFIDERFGKRKRSEFLEQVAESERKRLERMEAVEASAGCWNKTKHPELKHGSEAYVKKLRAESDKRLERLYGSSS